MNRIKKLIKQIEISYGKIAQTNKQMDSLFTYDYYNAVGYYHYFSTGSLHYN
jgi:hypothetical protein